MKAPLAPTTGMLPFLLCLVFWAGLAIARPAFALNVMDSTVDPSDLWWTNAEPGWGMQLVQGGNAVFATLFLYDVNGNPIFFTATLSAVADAWVGPLNRTTGPYYGRSSFDPAQVAIRAVGTLTFRPTSSQSGQIVYSVDGVVITKAVQRQLLRYENYSGHYAISAQRTTSNCTDPSANSDDVVAETIVVSQTGTTWAVDWTSARRACRYTGNYGQAGKLGYAETAYTCSDGEEGSVAFFDLTRRNGLIAGSFRGHGLGNACDYLGHFAGISPN